MGKSKEEKKKNHIGKVIFILFLIIIFVAGCFLGYFIYRNGGGLKGLLATALGQDAETLENVGTLNVLLLGVSEDIEAELTDTIMVCSYNPKTQRASMLSVPRDTFVGKNKAKATGNDKINSLYSSGGATKTLKAVEEITGMDIPYYAVINNQVVIDLVNDIGGVYFDVPIDMNYDDKTQDLHIHLEAGYQKLDGEHAEQLLRFRHNNNGTSYPTEYGDNDYGRMKTQREFTMEVVKQTLSLKNITHIRSIMATIFEDVETNLTLNDIFPYVPWAVSFSTENIISNQVAGQSEKCNELWFFVYNEEETEEIITEITNYLDAIDETEEELDSNTAETNSVNNTTTQNTTNTTKK